MTNTSTARDQAASSVSRPPARSRALGVAGAVLAPLALWAFAVPVLGIELTVRPGSGSAQVVTVGTVAAASALASALGWGLLAVLERRSGRARTIWTGTAVLVLLVSLSGPLTSATTAPAKAVLVLMHLSVAGVLISALRSSSPTR